jgi:hypothetical protein
MSDRVSSWIREPRIINAVQLLAYSIAGVAGLLAALGGIPTIVTGTIGPVMAVAVGTILVIGGALGAFSVIVGYWWLERVALLLSGLGYTLLLFVTVWFAVVRTPVTSTIWLIVALEVQAIGAHVVRFRRIDWAYLDPTR